MARALYAVGGAVLTSGLALLSYQYLFGDYRTVKDIPPDDIAPGATTTPGKTGWKRVDALLPKLRAISSSTGIPLGLLVAWVCKESGGNLASHTSLDERGIFQLMPAESKKLGLDHARLSSDMDYSLDAGVKLIQQYYADALALGVAAAPAGSPLAWILTKLIHTVGGGQTRKWVKAAQVAGALGSWGDFEAFVLGQHWTGPQPKKWMPFMDSIYQLGRPFGFGSESAPLVAGIGGGACVYCADGYCELCDGADGLGTCDCKCQRRGASLMAGLDFLGAS